MTASDYVGLATLITAAGAAIVSIIVALRQREVKTIVTDTKAQLETPNGATVGQIVAANDLTGVQANPSPEVSP